MVHLMPAVTLLTFLSSSDYDCLSTWERSSTTVDGKPKPLGILGLNQVTAHAVVSSFIHKNKFEGYNHLVLAILINTVDLALAFYAAESDVLIHIPLPWRDIIELITQYGSIVYIGVYPH